VISWGDGNMDWEKILKDEDEDLIQELEILFRGFPVIKEMTPMEEHRLRRDAGHLIEDKDISRVVKNPGIEPYIQSMKFMQGFPEIKRDGLFFVMTFESYKKTLTLRRPIISTEKEGTTLYGIGIQAFDTFPTLDHAQGETRFCIKAQGVMTNGDMMIAILLASKNDQLPAIITLPAYLESFLPQVASLNGWGVLFNDEELRFKAELYRIILDKIEGLEEIEIPTLDELSWGDGNIDWLNEKLSEYVPNKVLGVW
jgi:hypothetical protein